MMIDYGGKANRAFVIGLNETIGYVAVALFNFVTAWMIDEDEKNYRKEPYYMIAGFMLFSLVVGIFLKDTKKLVDKEH